jgi:hypothetical protein
MLKSHGWFSGYSCVTLSALLLVFLMKRGSFFELHCTDYFDILKLYLPLIPVISWSTTIC